MSYAAGSRGEVKVEAAIRTVIAILVEDAKAGGDTMSIRAIEDAVDGEHPRQSTRDAIRKAVDRGLVAVEEGPHHAKLHRIANPCQACGLPVVSGDPRHLSCPPDGPEGLFQ